MAGAPEPAPSPGSPPRLDPEVALAPGRRDASALLTLWLVRRSFTWLLFLGLTVGTVAAAIRHDEADLDVDTSSTGAVLGGIVTPFGLVFVAIVVRLAASWSALGLAYWLARAHERDLGLPPRSARRVASHLDRFRVARAFRELRWTRGVRGAAQDRLGPGSARYRRLERLVGIADAVTIATTVVAIVAFGATIRV